MTFMLGSRPFQETLMDGNDGLQPDALLHLFRLEPCPRRPADASGRFTKGPLLHDERLGFAKTSHRSA